MSAITVTVKQLQKGLTPQVLEKAFGPNSLGILLVSGLPEPFKDLRTRVLSSMSTLASLPPSELEPLERSEAMWLSGWSRGREKFPNSGLADFNKGSFYINCAFCKDSALEAPARHIVEKYPDFKMYTEPNVWPRRSIPGLQTFEADCKKLCKMIVDIGASVARSCDQYIASTFAEYQKGFLERITRTSTCTKARLLHYYADGQAPDTQHDSWCGEHVDHSCLTGLTSALFMDVNGPLERSPDKDAGLYIRDRHGNIVQMNIPSDCLAFQSGSTLQEISKGSLRAVPHYVRGTNHPGISRNTLAVFCQPDLDERVNETEDFASYAKRVVETNH